MTHTTYYYCKAKSKEILDTATSDALNYCQEQDTSVNTSRTLNKLSNKAQRTVALICLASLVASCAGTPAATQAQENNQDIRSSLDKSSVTTSEDALHEARDIIVLIDRSGSNKKELEGQLRILKELCSKLDEHDRINIFSYTYNDASSFQVGGNNHNNPLASYALNLTKSAAQDLLAGLEEDHDRLDKLLSSLEENRGKAFEEVFETVNRNNARNIVLVLTDDIKGVDKSGEELFDESFLTWMNSDQFKSKTQGFAYTPGQPTQEYFLSIGFKLIQNKVDDILETINIHHKQEDPAPTEDVLSSNNTTGQSSADDNKTEEQNRNNPLGLSKQELTDKAAESSQKKEGSIQNASKDDNIQESKEYPLENLEEDTLHPLKNAPARNQGKLAKTSDETSLMLPSLIALMSSLGLGAFSLKCRRSARTDGKHV